MLPQGRCRISPSGGFCALGHMPDLRQGETARQPVRKAKRQDLFPGCHVLPDHGDAGWSSPPTGSRSEAAQTASGLPFAARSW